MLLYASLWQYKLPCTGRSSQDHCNAHGGRSLYRDMRAAAQRSAASPPALPSASGAAGPSAGSASAPRRQSFPTSPHGVASGGSAAAGSKLSMENVPAAAPPSSAARPDAVSGQSAGSHSRAECVAHRFHHQMNTENHPHCDLVGAMI